MNAYGIIPGAAATGTVGSAAGSSAGSQAANGPASGFAGMLVQVIGGGASSSTQTASQGMPVGLVGLMGLLGQTTAESGSTELLALLNGLSEQLNKLDPNAELPADLQDQLAALLIMLQSLLQMPGANMQQQTDLAAGLKDGLAAEEGNAELPQPAPSPMQTIAQALRQSVQQLTDRLVQGETLPVQQTAIAEPLRQALQALRQITADQHSATDAAQDASQQGTRTAIDSSIRTAPSRNNLSQHGQAADGVKAQSVVHHTTLPLRNPAWTFQAANAASDAGQTASAQAGLTAESAEPVGSNNTVPVWTMLKGDSIVAPAGGTTQAPASAQVPVQQFAEQMGKFLVKQFVLTQGNGASEAKISLHPEHLGQVDIKLVIQNGLLTAKFMTENGAARDLLEAQMSQLRTALQGQGLQVEKMEVVQQSSAGAASFFQQQHRQQNSDHPDSRTGNRRTGDSYEDIAEFELELERTAYLRESGFGSSLNVTA